MNSMSILLVSDTHNSASYILKLREVAQNRDVDMVMHLGDDYEDADGFLQDGVSVIRVPGTWTPEYHNFRIENRRYETLMGWCFFLTHTPQKHKNDLPDDLDPEKELETKKMDVFLHGHLHHPKCEQVGDVWVINPGHCYQHDNRGYPPTFVF